MSRRACFSPYHFLRVFRQVFKKTPHQYLTQRRIEKAKHLLSHSNLTVTEVCFLVGFESLGSFSTLFHHYVGQPPTLYRMRIYERKQAAAQSPELAIPACFLKSFRIKNN